MSSEDSTYITYRTNKGITRKTYSQCYQDAIALSYAFRWLGVNQGDIIAVHGGTSYAWFVTDLSCVLTGAVSLALYPSAPRSRVLAAIKEMKVSLLLTEDYDHCKEYTDFGCKVICLSNEDKVEVDSVASLIAQFINIKTFPTIVPVEPFTIVSTSGTLSEPKFFAVHSYPLLYTIARFKEIYNFTSQDSLLMALPQAHLPQRMLTYGMIKNRIDIILSNPTRLIQDSIEFAPTIHVIVPRLLQHINSRLSRTSNLQQQKAKIQLSAENIFGPKARCIFIGSAPTPMSLLEKFQRMGCPIFEVYGTTELGIIAINSPQHQRLGTVGKVVDWGSVMLEPHTSEVLFSTDVPFLYGLIEDGNVIHDEKFGREFTGTGDIGRLDKDGYLRLAGRIKDFVALLSGEKIFVRHIEEEISKIQGIEACVIAGNGERELSALIFVEPNTKFGNREVQEEHIGTALMELNHSLHPWERIKKFLLIDESPTVENGCLTETLKLRRHIISERYAKNDAQYCLVPGTKDVNFEQSVGR
jgi:long-chain acyl-CoA synthetase